MHRYLLALWIIVIIVDGIVAARAQLMMMDVGPAASGSALAGKLLLVDGVSFLLQTDGTSKVCRAGGC